MREMLKRIKKDVHFNIVLIQVCNKVLYKNMQIGDNRIIIHLTEIMQQKKVIAPYLLLISCCGGVTYKGVCVDFGLKGEGRRDRVAGFCSGSSNLG